MKPHNSKWLYRFLMIGFWGFLCLFRNQNLGIDGYYFLAQFQYSQNLFEPHHLLHHLLYFYFAEIIRFIFHLFGASPISYAFIFQSLNALFFVLSLHILWKMRGLLLADKDYKSIAYVAFSGVGLRYATDVEVYLFPLFLSLLGTYKILKYLKNHFFYDFLLGSFFLCFAILNHQIQFWWWLVLTFFIFIRVKSNYKVWAFHILFSVLVPLTYAIVAYALHYSFWEFALHDYLVGSAKTHFDHKNLLLTLINLIRTLFFFNELLFQPPYPTLAIALSIPTLLFLFPIVKKLITSFSFQHYYPLIFSLLGVLMIFIIFSHGNYEFMVAVPFLVALLLPKFSSNLSFILLALLFLWNFIFLLYPFHTQNLHGMSSLFHLYQKNADAFWLLKESYLFRNYLYFRTGVEKPHNIMMNFEKAKVDSLLNQKTKILTDYPNPELMNRRSYLSPIVDWQAHYHYQAIDSFKTFYGVQKIYQIMPKAQ